MHIIALEKKHMLIFRVKIKKQFVRPILNFTLAEMGQAEMEVELAKVFQPKSLKELYARLSLYAAPNIQSPSQIQT
jgi:hypothetical protein